MAPALTTETFLLSMREQIRATLTPLLRGAPRVALLDFPDYTNVGDSLIWLGQLRALRDAGAGRLVYVATQGTYDRAELARAIGDGIILITGGGNLGDIWTNHQEFRERVLADFPGNRVIQLPQSIAFRDPIRREQAARAFRAHPDFTLMVRSERSVQLAADLVARPPILCPDMALALSPLHRPVPATAGAVFLARTDQEADSHQDASMPPWVERVDWVHMPPTVLTRLSRGLLDRPRAWRHMGTVRAEIFRRLAVERLHFGASLLSRGRVVITDRLHGHVLAGILGLPHFLLDNSYGKVRALWDTWTSGFPGAVWCDSVSDALARAGRILGEPPAG